MYRIFISEQLCVLEIVTRLVLPALMCENCSQKGAFPLGDAGFGPQDQLCVRAGAFDVITAQIGSNWIMLSQDMVSLCLGFDDVGRSEGSCAVIF